MVVAVIWISIAAFLQLAVARSQTSSAAQAGGAGGKKSSGNAGRSDLRDLGVIPKADFIVPLLSNTLFFTIVTNLFSWLSCDYGSGVAVLNSYPEMQCWTGSHSAYAAVAMITLCIYLIAANWIGGTHRIGWCCISTVNSFALFLFSRACSVFLFSVLLGM